MESYTQRLSRLEDSAAKLAATRSQLLQNVDKVYNTIYETGTAQVSLVRNREEVLTGELRRLYEKKVSEIDTAQRRVYEAIGACKQVLKNGVEPEGHTFLEVGEPLIEPTHIDFAFDLLSMRSAISNFGTVSEKREIRKSAKGSTLPPDFEMYDDDVDMWLAKKWTGNSSKTPTVSNSLDDVKNWINHLPEHPANKDMNILVSEVEANSVISDTASSFDVVAPTVVDVPITKGNDVIGQKFLEHLSRPMTDWLCKVSAAAAKSETDFVPYSNTQRTVELTEASTSSAHEFVDVIKSVQESDNASWVSRKRQHDVDTDETSPKEWKLVEEEDVREDEFNEVRFIDKLVSMFGRSMSAVASKKSEVELADVEQWKKIVEHMQSSQHWIKRDV